MKTSPCVGRTYKLEQWTRSAPEPMQTYKKEDLPE